MLNKKKMMSKLLCLMMVVIMTSGCAGNAAVKNEVDSDAQTDKTRRRSA